MARRGRKPAQISVLQHLSDALDFASVALKADGTATETHFVIQDGYVKASNGVLSAGARIENALDACPHGKTLMKAVGRCIYGGTLNQLENGSLRFTSGKFGATVNCCSLEDIVSYQPDYENGCQIGNEIKTAFGMIGVIAKESATTVLQSSLLLETGIVTATDRIILAQHQHPYTLPAAFVVPKQFVDAIWKCKKNLVGATSSFASLTFWFEDGAWIATRLLQTNWPDVSPIFDGNMNYAAELPTDFFEAVSIVAPFADKLIWLHASEVRSHERPEIGATQGHGGFNAKVSVKAINAASLALVSGFAKWADFASGTRASFFYGENIRAAIVHNTDEPETA